MLFSQTVGAVPPSCMTTVLPAFRVAVLSSYSTDCLQCCRATVKPVCSAAEVTTFRAAVPPACITIFLQSCSTACLQCCSTACLQCCITACLQGCSTTCILYRKYRPFLDLEDWRWLVISHWSVWPPTPGAPKDHPSSSKIARCRYPCGGGAEFARIRKREILAGSILQMVNLHAS